MSPGKISIISKATRESAFKEVSPKELLLEDKNRKYGEHGVVPISILTSIGRHKRMSTKKIKALYQQNAVMLLNLHAQCVEGDEKLKREMLPHVKEIMASKNVEFILRCLAAAAHTAGSGISDENKSVVVEQTRRRLVEGAITKGPIPPSGFWKIDARQKMQKRERKEDESKIRLPRRHWSGDEDRIIMKQEAERMIQCGKWRKISRDSLKQSPVICFVVNQAKFDKSSGAFKMKRRVCCDFRKQNVDIAPNERLRLNGVRCTLQMIQLALHPADIEAAYFNMVTQFQQKKDLNADVKVEKSIAENYILEYVNHHVKRETGAIDHEEAEGEIAAVNSEEALRNDAVNLDRRDKEGEDSDDEDTPGSKSYSACVACLDMESYYYQFASKTPGENQLALPTGGDAKEVEYTLVDSLVTVFGSLSSVFEDVANSEAIQLILNVFLSLPCSVYIDDVTIVARKGVIKEAEFLVELFMNLSGIGVAYGKSESHDRQRIVTALGIDYLRNVIRIQPKQEPSVELMITIPRHKIDRADEILAKSLQSIAKGNLEISQIDSAKGYYRYVCHYQPCLRSAARAIDPWSNQTFFESNIKLTAPREALVKALSVMRYNLKSIRSLKLRSPSKVRHMYSDASLEIREGKAVVVMGGAFLVRSIPYVWQLQMNASDVPEEFAEFYDRAHIGVFEILALHITLQKFKDYCTEEEQIVCHVDNIGACYIASSVSSKCLASQVVACVMRKNINRLTYFTFISTFRNKLADAMTRAEKFQKVLESLRASCGGRVRFMPMKFEDIEWDEYIETGKEIKGMIPEKVDKKKRKGKRGGGNKKKKAKVESK